MAIDPKEFIKSRENFIDSPEQHYDADGGYGLIESTAANFKSGFTDTTVIGALFENDFKSNFNETYQALGELSPKMNVPDIEREFGKDFVGELDKFGLLEGGVNRQQLEYFYDLKTETKRQKDIVQNTGLISRDSRQTGINSFLSTIAFISPLIAESVAVHVATGGALSGIKAGTSAAKSLYPGRALVSNSGTIGKAAEFAGTNFRHAMKSAEKLVKSGPKLKPVVNNSQKLSKLNQIATSQFTKDVGREVFENSLHATAFYYAQKSQGKTTDLTTELKYGIFAPIALLSAARIAGRVAQHSKGLLGKMSPVDTPTTTKSPKLSKETNEVLNAVGSQMGMNSRLQAQAIIDKVGVEHLSKSAKFLTNKTEWDNHISKLRKEGKLTDDIVNSIEDQDTVFGDLGSYTDGRNWDEFYADNHNVMAGNIAHGANTFSQLLDNINGFLKRNPNNVSVLKQKEWLENAIKAERKFGFDFTKRFEAVTNGLVSANVRLDLEELFPGVSKVDQAQNVDELFESAFDSYLKKHAVSPEPMVKRDVNVEKSNTPKEIEELRQSQSERVVQATVENDAAIKALNDYDVCKAKG